MTPYSSIGSNGLSRPLSRRTWVRGAQLGLAQARNGAARERQRVRIVFRIVIGDAGTPAVNVGAAQRFRVDLLAGRGAHQGRAAEENPPLVAYDDGVIGHGRYIRAAGGA